MEGRGHRERLLSELSDIRSELMAEAGKIPADKFGWAPGAGMKTFKDLLQEIGTMEKICTHWSAQEEMLEWGSAVKWSGDDLPSTLKDLQAVREETTAYLNGCTEETLETPAPLPESWHGYFGGPTVEPEEMMRWVARHEYYHLGQIVSYLWILGFDPHKS